MHFAKRRAIHQERLVGGGVDMRAGNHLRNHDGVFLLTGGKAMDEE